MIFGPRPVHAFSLVELTLALGIAAFCLIAVFGLIPIAVQTNRNAASQTAAASIMAAVAADLRATPKQFTTSTLFCIQIGTSTPPPLYFDSEGRCSSDPAGSTSPCGVTWNPALQTRYQLNITFSQQSPTPAPPMTPTIYADLKVTWPATATTANASGSAEMFVSFDRN